MSYLLQESHESRQVIQKGARCHAMQQLPFSEVPRVRYLDMLPSLRYTRHGLVVHFWLITRFVLQFAGYLSLPKQLLERPSRPVLVPLKLPGFLARLRDSQSRLCVFANSSIDA